MANYYKLSQLDSKYDWASITNSDVVFASLGTSSGNLSSVALTITDLSHHLSQNFGSLSATSTTHTNYFANNIGIGTNWPGDMALAVAGSISARDDLYIGGKAYLSAGDSGTTYLGDQATDTHIFTGKVGIGTASPSQQLHIQDTTGDVMLAIDADTGSGDSVLALRNSVKIWNVGMDHSVDDNLVIATGSGWNNIPGGAVMTMTTGGNVGIGTTAPTSPLHVENAENRLVDLYSSDVVAYIQLRDSADSLFISSDNTKGSFGGTAGAHANNLNIDLTNGNVGIGTTSPSAVLHINTTGDGQILLEAGSGDYEAKLSLYADSGEDNTDQWHIVAHESTTLRFRNYTNDRMVITNNGNVGIGTVTPDEPLEVSVGSDSNSDSGIKITNTSTGSYGCALLFDHELGDTGSFGVASKINSEGSASGSFLRFFTHNETSLVERMRILSDGNVGIGTTTPTHPLQVSGAISMLEKSADPSAPAEGQCVIWMSDGTGKGADGDVLIASQAGGTTKYATLFDHSAGSAW